jgi:hypothetical protein
LVCSYHRVVNAISTHGEPSPVWFVLLWRVVTDNMAISICASLGDIQFLDEEAGDGACVLTNTLEQSPEFISKASWPYVLIFGDLDELAIFKCVACVFFDDSANETA